MRFVSHALVFCVAVAVAIPSPLTAADRPGIQAEPLNVPSGGKVGFTLLRPEQTGLFFTNTLAETISAENRVLNNGSGVAAGDFDNDGLVDLFFSSLNQGNRLYRNLGGWKFRDVTGSSGLRFPALYYRSAVFADVNGDRSLDLLVGSLMRGVLCFTNDGSGRFADGTVEAGTATPFANETIALADIDGNGTLDLYACNNRNDDIRDWARVPILFVNKQPTVPPQMRNRLTFHNGPLQEYGEPDVLFLNDGRGRFAFASWTNGAFFDERGHVLGDTPMDWGLAAAFRDLNGDGAPDLYVCNDYWTPDRIWINGGRGRFKEIGSLAVRKIPSSSMGADFSDINRDGHVDIFAVDMLSRRSELRRRQAVAKSPVPPSAAIATSRIQVPRNTLLLNRGDGTFSEIAFLAGLEASEWSWSPLFLDVDLDGYDDLLVTSGHVRDIQDLDANDSIRSQQEAWRRTPLAATNLQLAFNRARREHAKSYPPLNTPVLGFRNQGDLRFRETTLEWGLNIPSVNHGATLADLDHDGDLDLVVNRLGAQAAVFRNDGSAPRIAVRLRGRSPNTQAIGAKVELLGAPVSNQVHEITAGGHYTSGLDTLRAFAPGTVTQELVLRVTWRDQTVSEFQGIQPNHRYELDEELAPRIISSSRARNSPLFGDVSALLNHRHQDAPFDDFARQPLLPRKLSQGGPGLSWFDVDGDGWDDLTVGAGRGGTLATFRNRKGKAFLRATNRTESPRDQTTILGWLKTPDHRALLVGSSSYEHAPADAPAVASHDPVTGSFSPEGASGLENAGPMALADVDADGDLDLFIGGAAVPGAYPNATTSRLLRHNPGGWSRDHENSRKLTAAGLVNGAVWSDLNSDGWPELVLACEWGPLRVFQNQRGDLSETTSAWALGSFTGLWQSVAAGDFNGDGRMDLVAGNWGLNSGWQVTEQPLTIFYGDLGGRGFTDILETEFQTETRQRVPRRMRDEMASSIPWLTARFPTHAAWSRATAADVMGEHTSRMHSVSAAHLQSMVFLNRGDRFEGRPLPIEAQFAPTFGVAVADFDGDGREDVFLAQNFFGFRLEDSRLDASQGLLLLGDGEGNFKSMSPQWSGIQMHGEQRGAALADFDQDARIDLAVGQHNGPTALFRNARAQRGRRIRLQGGAGNPTGVGATIRLGAKGQWGPAREIHAGSGYWSQNSATVILADPTVAPSVEVRWPGGTLVVHPLPSNTPEVVLPR